MRFSRTFLRTASRVAVATVLPLVSLHAQNADSVAAVKVAQELLRAISTRDTAAARRVMLPGAHIIAVADPANPTRVPQIQSDSNFYRTLPDGKQVLLERMWQPVVTLHGSVATVHTPYDFHIDGKFSHCGTDVFTLVKSMGEWRISAITYTAQRTGCAPSPLGPPAP